MFSGFDPNATFLPLPSSRSTQRKLRLPMRSTLNSVDLHGTTGLDASILHAIAFGRLYHQSIAVRLILAPCSRSGNSHEQK